MRIIYLVSLVLLFLSLILFKRSDKKSNVIISIIYTSCIIYFFDLIVAAFLSFLNIKNTLFMFSLVNYLISFLLYLINKHKYKKISFQKYYLNKKELICFIIIIVLCLIYGAFRYSFFTSTNYRISDATVHFKMSYDYKNYMKLFDKGYFDPFYGFSNSMYGFYVPCGIMMNALPFKATVSFNIFNTCFLCLLSLSFFATLLIMKKDDKHNVFVMVLTLLYTLAYPLNYSLFGFGYLGPGILASTLIILTWKMILKYNDNYLYVFLFLFNFGLFTSYYLFVPAVFLAEGLFMIYLFVKGKYSLKKLFICGFLCLIIPTLYGFFYLINHEGFGAGEAINSYSIDGFSYKNLIGNYVLLLLPLILSIFLQVKKRKVDFDLSFLICVVLYIIGTFIFIGSGYVSPYYFYKSYYILWIVVNLFMFKLVYDKSYYTLLKINYFLIILVIVFSIFDVEKMVSDKNQQFAYSGVVHQLGDIYDFNYEMFTTSLVIDEDEIDLMMSARKHDKECGINKKNNDLPYLNGYSYRRWFYMINGIVPAMDYKKGDSNDVYTRDFNYDSFMKSEKVKCLTVSNKYEKEKKLKIDYSKFDILYKNKYGKLIKKK